MTELGLDRTRRDLTRFARIDAAGVSPLYSHLAEQAADDPEIVALLTAAGAQPGTPTVLLFFAAVHRAVQSVPFHELANYYPSVGGSYGVDGATWPLFRSFVL